MKQVLSLSLRPKTFAQMVGAQKLIKNIQGHYKNDRMPPAWMFIGETGCGKTTIARIMSVALQCDHQEEFGNPCIDCRRQKSKFDILEINASKITTKDEVEEVTSGYIYAPRPGNKTRVFILDEAQKLSDGSQNLLLERFESCPKTTVWIICTTKPDSIIRTLRSRCLSYTVPSFGLNETMELIQKAIKLTGGKKNAEDLAEALLEGGITSPRMILMAVEKYLAGSTAEEAARVELSTEFDVTVITSAVRKGNWERVVKHLRYATSDDAVLIRAAMSNYFREIMYNDPISFRGDQMEWAIGLLAKATAPEDSLKLPVLSRCIYKLCKEFAKNKV